MEMLKRLAPNYWAGYYAVYVLMTALLAAVFRAHLRAWPETEALFVAAAIFAVSAGVALLSAIIAEGGGIHGSANTEKNQKTQRRGPRRRSRGGA